MTTYYYSDMWILIKSGYMSSWLYGILKIRLSYVYVLYQSMLATFINWWLIVLCFIIGQVLNYNYCTNSYMDSDGYWRSHFGLRAMYIDLKSWLTNYIYCIAYIYFPALKFLWIFMGFEELMKIYAWKLGKFICSYVWRVAYPWNKITYPSKPQKF